MNIKNIAIVIVTCSLLTPRPGLTRSTDLQVSPELAKKSVILSYGSFVEGFYEQVKGTDMCVLNISDPLVINSYDGKYRWYLFYANHEDKKLPTPEEMIEAVSRSDVGLLDKPWRTFWVGGWKYERTATNFSGIPSLFTELPRAETRVKDILGTKELKYIGAYLWKNAPYDHPAFEFEVNGRRYLYTSATPGKVYSPEEFLKARLPSGNFEDYSEDFLRDWERVEEAFPDSLAEARTIHFDDVVIYLRERAGVNKAPAGP